MTPDEIGAFISTYDKASRDRIRFDWNRKHGKDFFDANRTLRKQVLEAVLEAPGQTSSGLLRDLFEAEALFSREAWGVDPSFAPLGALLLKRDGKDSLDHFATFFGVSMDTYAASHSMQLDPVTVAALSADVVARISAIPEGVERDRLEVFQKLMGKFKDGNPTKGWVSISADKMKEAKLRATPLPESWLSKLKRLFRTK